MRSVEKYRDVQTAAEDDRVSTPWDFPKGGEIPTKIIFKLDFQEKNLNLDRDLNHGSQSRPRFTFFSENLICKFYKAWNL